MPAQALALLNSPLAREQAAAFARRLVKECGQKPEEVVPRAWRLAFGREPTADETDQARAFLRKRTEAADAESALADLCLGTLVLRDPHPPRMTEPAARQVARRHSQWGKQLRAEDSGVDSPGAQAGDARTAPTEH